MVIYKIVNKINSKVYIGQTTQDLSVRFKQHCSVSNTSGILNRAIRKHGSDNFTISVIARCNTSEEMNHREAYYIKLFNTLSPAGYNLDSGGKHKVMHKQSRQKMSISKEGKRNLSPTCFKKGHISWNKNKSGYHIHSEEFKNKMSAFHTGKKYRLGMQSPNKGRKFSLEYRKKLSDAHIGQPSHMKGKKHTEECKQKISQALKNRPGSKTSFPKRSIIDIDTGISYSSILEAARIFNLASSKISLVCSGKRKSVGGHRFIYKQPSVNV